MKKLYKIIFMSVFLFVAGCGTNNAIDRDLLDEYEVKQTFDEVVQGDFTLRLASEKSVYKEGDEVNMFAEIIYTGEEDEVTISHSEYALYFTLHDQIRDYHIYSAIREIGAQSTLSKSKPYRVDYDKQAVYTFDDETDGYAEFIEDFIARDDYPIGYYTVSATAMFHDGEDHREWTANIEFKVE
ncbi:hypothetical protein [Oceanobacillus sp. CAU 1775]